VSREATTAASDSVPAGAFPPGFAPSGIVKACQSRRVLILQIVALLRYVDSCSSAPSPHPDCPIASTTSPPPTQCLAACRETLRILLQRGRSTIKPAGDDFDARQLRLSESPGPPSISWHTSSLVQEAAKAAGTLPYMRSGGLHLKRWVYATSALGALACRGVDPEALVRYGMADRIKIGISAWLGRTPDASGDEVDTMPNAEAWRRVFEIDASDTPSPGSYICAAFKGPVARKLDAWLASAALDEILRWTPPTAGELKLVARPAAEIERWTWIVERFTMTYLDRWSMASLRREYLERTGSRDSTIPGEVVAERVVPLEAVSGHIAALAVRRDSQMDRGVLAALTEQAVELLRDGQRRAAAALFDGARTLSPGDITATNNYAFCIVVDHPAEARELFRQALEQDISPRTVTLCNMALAELLTGDRIAAQGYRQEALDLSSEDDRKAYLWERTPEGQWRVTQQTPRDWVRSFAGMAETSGEARSKADLPDKSDGESLSQVLDKKE
jgi:hypothetical protein